MRSKRRDILGNMKERNKNKQIQYQEAMKNTENRLTNVVLPKAEVTFNTTEFSNLYYCYKNVKIKCETLLKTNPQKKKSKLAGEKNVDDQRQIKVNYDL